MPRTNRSEEEEESIQAFGPDFLEGTARSLRILNLFGPDLQRMTMSDVANRLKISRATARRTLFTLAQLGYLRAEGNSFVLTPRVLAFASAFLSSDVVATVMQPLVQQVSERLNHACAAGVLDGGHVVLVARASPSRALTADMRIGYRLPGYCTSVGRILLGCLKEDEFKAAFDSVPIVALTSKTITDPNVLRARIIADREQGFSVVDEEAEEGFRSIAVPVFNRANALICAVHVGIHTGQASVGVMIDDFLPVLKDVAAEARTMLL
jgi:IclR family pca regulon transcriptional regulator